MGELQESNRRAHGRDAPLTPNHVPARDRGACDSGAHAAPPRRKPGCTARWLALALGIALAGAAAPQSFAQRPSITAPATIQIEPASQAPLGIRVDPVGSAPANAFVRLRGFPTSISLTEGHAIAPGAWAIPLFGLAQLRAIVPAGVSGRAEIVITLMDVDGNTLSQTRTALIIAAITPEKAAPEPPRALPPVTAPLPPPAPPKKVVVITPPSAPSSPPPMTADARAHADRMLAIATEKLGLGNISAARAFLQRAADAGLAEAALKLGATFDPAELARDYPMAVSSADVKEARRWYEKARELGAPEAEVRLGRLGAR
jgi:hypothetical protein